MKVECYKNEIIDMYCNKNLNTVEIASILGCSDSSVGRLLQKNGIERTHTPNELRLSKDDIIEICQRYENNETTENIGNVFGICGNSVSKILKENNIDVKQGKRYSPIKHHDYFEVINTPDKAYFLGWMISDGAIIENKTRPGRQKVISLEIHNKDRQILELFAQCLGADQTIIKTYEKRNHCHIRFSSDKMADDLSKYGVVPRKSYISYLPKIEKDLMSHLIRGIFDGDGTITIDKTNNGHIAFYGSEQICNDIADYLHINLGLNRNKVSKTTCYHVWYGGKKPVKILLDYLYNDCGDYYLHRKYVKFKQIV